MGLVLFLPLASESARQPRAWSHRMVARILNGLGGDEANSRWSARMLLPNQM